MCSNLLVALSKSGMAMNRTGCYGSVVMSHCSHDLRMTSLKYSFNNTLNSSR